MTQSEKQHYWTIGFVVSNYVFCRFLPMFAFLPFGLVLFGIAILLSKQDKRNWVLLGVGCCLMWLAIYSFVCVFPIQSLYSDNPTTISVELSDYPTMTSRNSYKFDAKVVTKNVFAGKICFYLEDNDLQNYSNPEPGDILTIKTTLQQSGNIEKWWHYNRSIRLYATATKTEILNIKPHSNNILYKIKYFPAISAKRFQDIISVLFQDNNKGFIYALLTGDRTYVSDTLTSELSRTGLQHIIAVSGLHTGVLIAFILIIPCDIRLKYCLAIPVLIWFCIMTGCKPSVIRAVIMCIIMLVSPFFKRDCTPWMSLRGALILSIFLNPFSIEQIGFQLSFLSVAGILLVTDKLKNLKHYKNDSKIRQFLRTFKSNAFESLCATSGSLLLTLPVTAFYFGTLPLIAPLSNFLIVWLILFIFLYAFIAVLIGCIFLPFAKIIVIPLNIILTALLKFLNLSSHIPYSAIDCNISVYTFWLIAFYVVLAVMLFKQKFRKYLKAFFICSIVALIGSIAFYTHSFKNSDISVEILDVGQGESIFLYSDNESVAIDCGGSDDAGDVLSFAMENVNLHMLDKLIFTHLDSDHMNGFKNLCERVTIDEIVIPVTATDSSNYSDLIETANSHNITISIIDEDCEFDFGNAKLNIFSPVETGLDNKNKKSYSNDSGLSVLVSSYDFNMLVTGDMSVNGEKKLLNRENILQNIEQLDIMVVGHHGSKTSTSEDLLKILKPQKAVISVGADNSYGHPSSETITRLNKYNCKIYRTDKLGNITFIIK